MEHTSMVARELEEQCLVFLRGHVDVIRTAYKDPKSSALQKIAAKLVLDAYDGKNDAVSRLVRIKLN